MKRIPEQTLKQKSNQKQTGKKLQKSVMVQTSSTNVLDEISQAAKSQNLKLPSA